MKNSIKLIIASLFILVSITSCKERNSENLETSIETESSTPIENTETQEESFSNWTCSICGNPMQNRGYEETMDGDWVLIEDENLQGQICSPSCGRKHVENFKSVTDKYGIDLEEQEPEHQQGNGQYHMGSDGRVYENNKCGLCKGTGIEKGRNIATGEVERRICPMCEGRGVRSY